MLFNSIIKDVLYQLLQLRLFTSLQSMQADNLKFQLAYSDDFQELSGNIMKTNAEFIAYLRQNEEIMIEGQQQDQIIFNLNENSYKLRGIFLPTTMLVTPQINKATHQLAEQTHRKPVSSVLLETGNYLKVQPYNIDYNLIYMFIMSTPVTVTELRTAQNIQQLLEVYGISISTIIKQFHITKSQFQKIARYSPFATYHEGEASHLQQPTILPLDISCLVDAMRKLVEIKMQSMDSPFQYDEVASSIGVHDEKILMVIAKIFHFEVNYRPQLSYQVDQSMQIQGEKYVYIYRLTLSSIVHFILQELALGQKEYILEDMDKLIEELLRIYLPVGIETFDQSKAKQKVHELIGYYFITVIKERKAVRFYYDSLRLESTIKERIKFMANHKKRFLRSEIEGVLSTLVEKEKEDINELISKHFRKYGKQYEIKLIIPK